VTSKHIKTETSSQHNYSISLALFNSTSRHTLRKQHPFTQTQNIKDLNNTACWRKSVCSCKVRKSFGVTYVKRTM